MTLIMMREANSKKAVIVDLPQDVVKTAEYANWYEGQCHGLDVWGVDGEDVVYSSLCFLPLGRHVIENGVGGRSRSFFKATKDTRDVCTPLMGDLDFNVCTAKVDNSVFRDVWGVDGHAPWRRPTVYARPYDLRQVEDRGTWFEAVDDDYGRVWGRWDEWYAYCVKDFPIVMGEDGKDVVTPISAGLLKYEELAGLDR